MAAARKGKAPDIFKALAPGGELSFKAGRTIFEEGSPAGELFIIKEGVVEIRKVTNRNEGKYKTITLLPKGEFFGEIALFLRESRTADAVAKTDVKLVALTKDDIQRLAKDDPGASFNVMEFLACSLMRRLRSTTEELAVLYETGKLIAAARGVPELARLVMEKLMKAVKSARAGAFVSWNEFNADFEVIFHEGFGIEGALALAGDDPLIGWLQKEKDVFFALDLKKDKRLERSGDKNPLYKGRSVMAAPLFTGERLTGFILLSDTKDPNAFSYDQMILLAAIASYVNVALENLQYMQEQLDRDRLSRMKSSIAL